MELLDFVGIIPGIILFCVLIIYRNMEVQHTRNMLKEQRDDIWSNVLGDIPASYGFAKSTKVAAESFTQHFENAEDIVQQRFSKSVFLNSYLAVIFFGSIFELALSATLPIADFVRIMILDSFLFPLFIILCMDVIACRYDNLRPYLLGDVEIKNIIAFIAVLIILQFSLILLANTIIPRNMWSIALQSMMLLQVLLSLFPLAMRNLGANYWKIEVSRIDQIKKACKEAMECAAGLFLLEEGHRVALNEFTNFFEQYDNHLFESVEPTLISSGIDSEIKEGRFLLTGRSTIDATNRVRRRLQGFYTKSLQDLRIRCYESYLDKVGTFLSENQGRSNDNRGDLLRLSFSFVKNEYLEYLVNSNSAVFTDENYLISALSHTVRQHHSPTHNQIETDLLSRIAMFVVKEGLRNGQVRMGNVTSRIEFHAPHVEKAVGYLEYALKLHQDENSVLEQPTDVMDIARIIYNHQSSIDDAVLEQIYNSLSTKHFSFSIVQACRPETEQSRDERIKWMIRFLRESANLSEGIKRQIVTPFALWLQRFRERNIDVEAFAGLLQGILSYDDIEDVRLDLYLRVSAKLLDIIEIYKKRMNKRTRRKESPSNYNIQGDILQRLFSTNETEVATLLLSIYGLKHYETNLPIALAVSIDVLMQATSFQRNEIFLDDIYKTLALEEKMILLQALFIESTTSFSDYDMDSILTDWSEFLNAVTSPTISKLEQAQTNAYTRIRVDNSRIAEIMQIHNHLTNHSWIDRAKGMHHLLARGWGVILGNETNFDMIILAFEIATSTSNEDIWSICQKLKSNYRTSDNLLVAMLRYWKLVDDSNQRNQTIAKRLLVERIILPKTDDSETSSVLSTFLDMLADAIIYRLFAPTRNEVQHIIADDCTELYAQSQINAANIGGYLPHFDYLLKGTLHIFTYLLNYQMVTLGNFNAIGVWDAISRIQSTPDETKVPSHIFALIRDLMEDMVTGGSDIHYLVFLQAVTTNNIPGSIGLSKLDELSREELAADEDALEFANLFSFIFKQGLNPLGLSHSELLKDLEGREKLAETDEGFHEEWETSRNILRLRIAKEHHWVDRLRFLDPELKKIRKAQTEIETLSKKLVETSDIAEKAATIANRLLNIQIGDQRIIEYISKRTYNYFLISWSTPRRSISEEDNEDRETFGSVVDDWLKNRKQFYGLTVRLGNSTRVGKIPRGMTFDEFKRLIGRDLMTLRSRHDISPQLFITCWSPSTHSAHALLGEDTLHMDPITALRTTFRKSSIEDTTEPIDQFIEQSLFGQTSMIESIAALSQGSANPMSFWEKDPIEFMTQIAVLSEDTQNFFSNATYRRKMEDLYLAMKGTKNLEQLVIMDGRSLALGLVNTVFKGYHGPTKESAIEAAGEMIDTLRIVLLLETK